MTRILTIIALLFATPASAQLYGKKADWALVLEGQFGKYYIDRNSIVKGRGNTFDFKMLMDLPKPDEGHSSSVWTQSMDCSKMLWKTKALQFWTGNMASGKIKDQATWSSDQQYWDDVDPMKNVDFYNLVKKLCSN